MSEFVQRSFAGGEVAPAVYGRPDQVKYQTGLRICRNQFVRRHGGVSNRTGSQWLLEVRDTGLRHRILKFVFNAEQTYVLLFGDRNLRFVRNGALVTVSNVAAWSGGVTYKVADLVERTGTFFYCVAGHANQAPPNADYWYVLPGDIYEIPTPYSIDDLATLYGQAQSGDVVSLDHVNHFPYELSRTGHTAWSLTLSRFEPRQAPPTGLSVVAGNAGTGTFRYKVTAVGDETFEESLPGMENPKPITGATQAAPCVVTVIAHGYAIGDEILIAGIVGMSQLNERTFVISAMTTDTISLSGIDSTTFGAYVSGGTARRTSTATSTVTGGVQAITGASNSLPVIIQSPAHGFSNGQRVRILAMFGMTELNGGDYVISSVATNTFEIAGVDSTGFGIYTSGGTAQQVIGSGAAGPTSAAPHVISWAGVDTAVEYQVYKEINGVFGFIGTAVGTSFRDTGITPDTTVTPPRVRKPFTENGRFPRTVGYFDQRRAHAGTALEPEKVFLSRSGRYSNFSTSAPLQDDDAITFTVAGKQVNEVRHLVDIGNLLILTSGGEWVALGDGSGLLLPDSIGLKQVGYNGASPIPPVVVGNNVLYIQARGGMIRDLRSVVSQDGTQGFAGDDLTVFAPHLFEGRTVVRWDYAQIPNSICWAVLSDGTLAGLTYIKAHEIAGWHRHDTDGLYEDLLVIPEGDEDVVYVLVARTIGGQVRRYLERFPSRRVTDVTVDARFLDSFLTYDGRNTSTMAMTLTGGTTWTDAEQLTLTAGSASFAPTDVDNAIEFRHVTPAVYGEDGVVAAAIDTRLQLTILAYVSPTVVTVRASKNVPDVFQGTPVTTWGRAVNVVGGLEHLEGKRVSILADGHVLANGFDAAAPIVTNGQVALGATFVVVHVGLPYSSDVELLDLEVLGAETILSKQKRFKGCTVYVEASRGIFAGASLDRMYEKPVAAPIPGEAIELVTGKIEFTVADTWNNTGRVRFRQRDPLPMSILSVMPYGDVGG